MNLSSSDEVRQLYDDSAESYEQTMDTEIRLPVYDKILTDLGNRLVNVEGAILDSSCGTGHMLERIRDDFAPHRPLVGIDLSPRMISLARQRLGDSATILEGDMASLSDIDDNSCASVLSFYAIHHVDRCGLKRCLNEWKRVLVTGGQLVLAAWEGSGSIDYGEHSDVVARRYLDSDVKEAAALAGFQIVHCLISPVDGFDMDAVHLLASNNAVHTTA